MAYVFNPFTGTLDNTGSGGISGIGDAVGSGTEGSVLFLGAGGVLAQDNANFFWNDSTDHLSIGTNTDLGSVLNILFTNDGTENGLTIRPSANYATGNLIDVQNAAGTPIIEFRSSGGLAPGNPQLFFNSSLLPADITAVAESFGLPLFGFAGYATYVYLFDTSDVQGGSMIVGRMTTGGVIADDILGQYGFAGSDDTNTSQIFSGVDARVDADWISGGGDYRAWLRLSGYNSSLGFGAWAISPEYRMKYGNAVPGTEPDAILQIESGADGRTVDTNLRLVADSSESSPLEEFVDGSGNINRVTTAKGFIDFKDSPLDTITLIQFGDYSIDEPGGSSLVYVDGIQREGISPGTVINMIAPVGHSAAVFGAGIDGDTYRQWVVGPTGIIEWGGGSGARDTNLYRSAAGMLKTDDSFTVLSRLIVGSNASGGAGGDMYVGQSGSSILKYDQSLGQLVISNSSDQNSILLRTISGNDTIFNEQGADINHRFEGDNDGNLLTLDAGLDAAGVGVALAGHVGKFHVDQSSATGAKPVLVLDQADVSEEFIRLIGTSTTDASQSLVDAADLATPGSIVGWFKIYIQDDQGTNPITDGVYYVPFYTAPTA